MSQIVDMLIMAGSQNIIGPNTPILFVTDVSEPKLTAVNLITPEFVTELDNIALDRSSLFLVLDVTNNIAYFGTNDNYINIVDISNPLKLVQLQKYYLGSGFFQPSGFALNVSTNTMFFAGGSGNFISSFDVSTPTNIVELQYFNDSANLPNAYDLAIDNVNNVLYVTRKVASTTASGVVSVDVSNPSSMSVLDSIAGSVLYESDNICLDTANSVLYVQTRDASVRNIVAIDVSTPSSLSIIATHNMSGSELLRSIALDAANQVLYVLETNRIVAVDVSTPASMSEVGTLSLTNISYNLEISGDLSLDLSRNLAYVVSDGKLTIIDISTPASMSEVDSYSISGFAKPRSCALNIAGPEATDAFS